MCVKLYVNELFCRYYKRVIATKDFIFRPLAVKSHCHGWSYPSFISISLSSIVELVLVLNIAEILTGRSTIIN